MRKPLLAAFLLLVFAAVAHGQTKKFYNKFKGQLVVSDQPFQVIDDDTGMSDQLKKNGRKELEGKQGEEAKSWDFYWIAVLKKKPGTPNLTMFFYEVQGKKKTQVTYKDLGADPEQTIIVADMSISEDDGLKKGTKYELVLATVDGKGKATTLASGQVLFK